MADNFKIPSLQLGADIAAKEVSGVKYPQVVLTNSSGTSGSADVTITTMQNAVSATGNGTSLDVSGKSVAVLQVTGTFVATVFFEASADDTNWFSINATQIGADTLVTSTTSTGLFRLSVGGLKSIRARVTWTSGTSITVLGRTTIADSHAKIVTLAAKTNLISRSTAYEASRQAVVVAGTFVGLIVHNSKASAQFIQVHDSASTPEDSAVPKEIFYVPAQTTVAFSVLDGIDGDAYANGIYVCNSSTGPTKTIGSADCWFTVRYR